MARTTLSTHRGPGGRICVLAHRGTPGGLRQPVTPGNPWGRKRSHVQLLTPLTQVGRQRGQSESSPKRADGEGLLAKSPSSRGPHGTQGAGVCGPRSWYPLGSLCPSPWPATLGCCPRPRWTGPAARLPPHPLPGRKWQARWKGLERAPSHSCWQPVRDTHHVRKALIACSPTEGPLSPLRTVTPHPCPRSLPGPAVPGFALASGQTPECACWLRAAVPGAEATKHSLSLRRGRTGCSLPRATHE